MEQIYDRHFAFVWRNLRRLGVDASVLDDAAQDVFLIAHRRHADFEGRSRIETWLFGIVRRVAHDYRRSLRRRRARLAESAEPLETVPALSDDGPLEIVERRQAVALMHRLLERMDDDARAILVAVELEQMSVPEAAEALGLNLNTAYSRLRTARLAFEQEIARLRARERRGRG